MQVLERIRGTADVDEELEDIKAACRESNKVTNPWAEILKRESRPQLFVALTATFFQQWTGINTVIFYGARCRCVPACGSRRALRMEACHAVMTQCMHDPSTWCARGVAGMFLCNGCPPGLAQDILKKLCSWMCGRAVSVKSSTHDGSVLVAPQLFISLGTGQRAALLATIVTGVVNHFATYVSLWAADSFGRRFLFLEGGVQMLLALVRAASLGNPPRRCHLSTLLSSCLR